MKTEATVTIDRATFDRMLAALNASGFALQSYADAQWADKTVPLRAEVLATVSAAKLDAIRKAPMSKRAEASF